LKVAIAIVSTDPLLCRSLEQLLRDEPTVALIGSVDEPDALTTLAKEHPIDVALIHAPSANLLTDWQISYPEAAWIAIIDDVDEENCVTAMGAGASGILPRSVAREEILAAIKAVRSGLVVFPRQLFPLLLNAAPLVGERDRGHERRAQLTPRELEVLAAMADGASNKAIARRLGISFHTAKFHVAAILEKLQADSRTEAVMKAAQLGVVML
jgi:DNA-binding NarL/FixJ family response regulator